MATASMAFAGVPTAMGLLGLILLVVIILLLVGAAPSWGHSRQWGYRPMGGLGVLLIVLVILLLLGVI